jgi:hypothetical protein
MDIFDILKRIHDSHIPSLVKKTDMEGIISTYIRGGGNLKKVDNRNTSLLHYSVRYSLYEVTHILLHRGVNPNKRSANFGFLIHQISYSTEDYDYDISNIKILKLLIQYGVNIKVKDFGTRSPLRYAKLCKNEEMIKILEAVPKVDTLYRLCLGVIRDSRVDIPKWVPGPLLEWRL